MFPLTIQEQRRYNNAIYCWVCKKELNGDSVKDHCHITGKYRGLAHKDCNLQLQIKAGQMHIPVIFHNLFSYIVTYKNGIGSVQFSLVYKLAVWTINQTDHGLLFRFKSQFKPQFKPQIKPQFLIKFHLPIYHLSLFKIFYKVI